MAGDRPLLILRQAQHERPLDSRSESGMTDGGDGFRLGGRNDGRRNPRLILRQVQHERPRRPRSYFDKLSTSGPTARG